MRKYFTPPMSHPAALPVSVLQCNPLNTRAPEAYTVSFKLETDPDLLVPKVGRCALTVAGANVVWRWLYAGNDVAMVIAVNSHVAAALRVAISHWQRASTAQADTHTSTHTHTHAHTHKYARTHACTHARTSARTHTGTQTHNHTHTTLLLLFRL